MRKLSAGKKSFGLSLIILGFIYYTISIAQATAITTEPGQIIKALKQQKQEEIHKLQKERYISSLRACRGRKMAYTNKKVVALTFDDGPSEKYTGKILEVLKNNNVKATFFMIGKNIEEYPSIVKKVFENGNIVANHSYSHHYLSKLEGEEIEQELTKTSKLIKNIINLEPALFRPPYGACSDKSRRVAQNLKLKTILWSATARDFNLEITSEEIASNIISLIKPGVIILLHDGGGNRSKTIIALQIIITNLKEQGYEFLTVPELLNIPAYRIEQPKKNSSLMLATKSIRN